MSLYFWSRLNPVFCLAALLLIQSGPTRAGAEKQEYLGDHHDSPVYFELFKEMNFDYEGVASLRENRLKIGNFPEVDISEFDWEHGGVDDRSWWSGADRLTFMLPFIDSDRETDRALAKKWFNGWYETFDRKRRQGQQALHDNFASALRGMVLVYFLKMEEQQADPDIDLIEKLRSAIYEHQVYLSHDRNFSLTSNHGLVQAIALIELTRAAPNSEFTKLGIERVLAIVGISVSRLGSHMEHAPAYHFAFLKWVSDIHDYCSAISSISPLYIRRLAGHRERLQYAAYFLQDHEGHVAEIGDSDSLVAGESNGWHRVVEPDHDETTLYDPDAGYAIYKGHPSTRDRRYVVFTNQNKSSRLVFHCHDDLLAVFYDYDGEIILGDQGRFEYTYSVLRRYFVSPIAHNTIFPKQFLTTQKGQFNFFLAAAVGQEEDEEAVRFNAQVRHAGDFFVDRSVVIRRGEKALCVLDSIHGPGDGMSGTNDVRRGRILPGSVQEATEEQRQLQRELVMVWNIGRDVESVRLEETKGAKPLVLHLKTRKGRRFRMSIDFSGEYDPDSQNVELARGELLPVRGWYSPQMLLIRPSHSLIITFEPTGAMNITTRVELVGRKPFPGLGPLLRGY